ncbi:MAG: Aspartyl-tRNA synthetase [Candidatus Saccharibacteria bacterium]|nr:Aspartyl-tRNA synthetase [Candidatus Saccharibacteria bacterium]
MRILSSDIAVHVGERIRVEGWLHKKRLMGGMTFINIRDRKGVVQIIVKDKAEIEKLRGLQIGTILVAIGDAVAEPRAPGAAELHNASLEVLVPITAEPPIEIDKPLSHRPDNLDTLFEYRPIGLRNLQETAIFKVQSAIARAMRDYFYQQEFTEIRTPKLLAAATEGGAEVFKIDYFGREATLAQSPQFYKQIMVGVFERVFEIAPVYRAEPSATTRHMTEYISIDGEMGFITIDDLKQFLSGLLNYVSEQLWRHHQADMDALRAAQPLLSKEIPSISMAEIHEKYSQANEQSTVGEKDLRPDEERWICEYAAKELGSEAVFVTDWPAEEMKFYHKAQAQNPEFADRFDLLFRGVEIATGSMRENDYNVVVAQLQQKAGGDPNDPGFRPLLQAMQAGMPPHGGFGMGLERVTQKFVGLSNVKEASLFPRDINRLAP